MDEAGTDQTAAEVIRRVSHFYLGVDGGQSSTIAVIGDSEGRVRGWATAGPCNHVGTAEGKPKFLRIIRECVALAARQAGMDARKPRFHAACLGMSGGPEDKKALLHEILDAEHLVVTHDGRIALAGATAGQPGVIVIGGTGSIAFGENALGETARIGGWGYIFGDEGGAFDLVRQALRAALREYEGWGPRTALTPAFMEATNCVNPNQLLHNFYTEQWPHARVAALAVQVSRIAEAGDPVAIDILNSAAGHLAMLAGMVRKRLWGVDESWKVSWIGGVFRSGILLDHFRLLLERVGGTSAAPPLHSPAIGALTIAWRAAGLRTVPERLPVPLTGIKT